MVTPCFTQFFLYPTFPLSSKSPIESWNRWLWSTPQRFISNIVYTSQSKSVNNLLVRRASPAKKEDSLHPLKMFILLSPSFQYSPNQTKSIAFNKHANPREQKSSGVERLKNVTLRPSTNKSIDPRACRGRNFSIKMQMPVITSLTSRKICIFDASDGQQRLRFLFSSSWKDCFRSQRLKVSGGVGAFLEISRRGSIMEDLGFPRRRGNE